VSGHPLFRDGVIEVQDEGSQLAALLVGARAGHQVVDICAGAGGKSLAMAAAIGNKGRLVAADISKGRLLRSKERLRRAGVDNVEPRQIEPERDRWVRRSRGKYDRVLVDAPCTGTGAWRRNPDARWRPVDLERVVARQTAILGQAARLAKPGGRVVYVTCSLLPEENEQVVDAVKQHDPALKAVPIEQAWDEAIGVGECPGTGDVLRLTPHRHGTDGFFVAVLERTADAPEPEAGEDAAEEAVGGDVDSHETV
jgi:16S rRNA (cytosine967-C5)-methyltransferase